MTTTSTNRIDWKNVNVLGATNVVALAKNEPAMPASTADSVKASVRIASGLTPIDPAAISESRTARIASPHPLCASRLYSANTIAISRMATTAMPRSPSDQPAIDGYGMFISPFWPPVTLSHSTAVNSTTKANAIVTIARYGPLTRKATSPSNAPMMPVNTRRDRQRPPEVPA